MIVLYWMTPDPFVVRPDTDLATTLALLHEKGIRRLPVVEDDELKGIVGRSDILGWIPPGETRQAPSPETAERLRSITVAQAMTPDPFTCDAYESIEAVCELMRRSKVGALPVLNRGTLVGIISEMDLLGALAELSYYNEGGSRITVQIPQHQRLDVLYSIMDLCRLCQLELLAVLTHPILSQSALMVTLRVQGQRIDDFTKLLWEAGYKVSDVSSCGSAEGKPAETGDAS